MVTLWRIRDNTTGGFRRPSTSHRSFWENRGPASALVTRENKRWRRWTPGVTADMPDRYELVEYIATEVGE